jgi:predicted transcriptional regulator
MEQRAIVTARLPLPLKSKLLKISERRRRSLNWILEQSLTEWVLREEERFRLTQEGLADATAGLMVDHEAVQAWTDSLDTGFPLAPPALPK